jgi:hypothetical protein
VEPKTQDYSISNSPEPDLKTLSISLHGYYTLDLRILLSTWSKIPVHVNLTSRHPGMPGAEASAEISPQSEYICGDVLLAKEQRQAGPHWGGLYM